MNWWLACMKKYADITGRARRTEYWMFFLFNIIFGMAAAILDKILGTSDQFNHAGLIATLYSLAILLPTLAVAVRRLHDLGKSGWWIFISLIPLVGIIWLFILMVTDSQPGENQYGPNPKTAQVTVQP